MSLLLLFGPEATDYSLDLEAGNVTITGGDASFQLTTTRQGTGSKKRRRLPVVVEQIDNRIRHHYTLHLGAGRIWIQGGDCELAYHLPRDPVLDDDEMLAAMLRLAV